MPLPCLGGRCSKQMSPSIESGQVWIQSFSSVWNRSIEGVWVLLGLGREYNWEL